MNSTRRLRSRPAAEVLLAIGLDSPRPTAETIDALTPRRIRAARTASARCVLRTALRPGSPLASVCASIRIGTGVLASAVAMASRVVCAEASSVGLERAKVIGDEQLPPDVEWNGMPIKQWPQWMVDGSARPSKRLTFTTWHHWTKDSQPVDSGLLGPVVLRPAARISVGSDPAR